MNWSTVDILFWRQVQNSHNKVDLSLRDRIQCRAASLTTSYAMYSVFMLTISCKAEQKKIPNRNEIWDTSQRRTGERKKFNLFHIINLNLKFMKFIRNMFSISSWFYPALRVVLVRAHSSLKMRLGRICVLGWRRRWWSRTTCEWSQERIYDLISHANSLSLIERKCSQPKSEKIETNESLCGPKDLHIIFYRFYRNFHWATNLNCENVLENLKFNRFFETSSKVLNWNWNSAPLRCSYSKCKFTSILSRRRFLMTNLNI